MEKTQSVFLNVVDVIIASVLPISFVVFWSYLDKTLPVADGAAYTFEAYRLYDKLVAHSSYGYIQTLKFLFIDRSWKPITFPYFLVPFIFIFQSKVGLALGALAGTSTMLLVATVYFLGKEVCKLSRLGAVLIGCTVGLMPGILNVTLKNFPETLALTASMAALLFLAKSNFFQKRSSSLAFAFFFFLALSIRPVETTLVMTIPVVGYIALGWQKKHIDGKAILFTIYWTFLFVNFLFFFPVLLGSVNVIPSQLFDKTPDSISAKSIYFIALTALTVLSLVFTVVIGIMKCLELDILRKQKSSQPDEFSKKPWVSSYLFESFFVFVFLNFLWWSPGFHLLFQWTYVTSFGVLGQELNYGFANSFLAVKDAVVVNASFSALIFFGLGLITLLWFKKGVVEIYGKILFFLVSPTLLPLLVFLFSTQQSARKLVICLPLLVIAVMASTLLPGPLYKIRTSLAGAIIGIQATLLCVGTLVPYQFAFTTPTNYAGYLKPPKSYDVNLAVYQYLETAQSRHSFNSVSLLLAHAGLDVFVINGISSTSLGSPAFFTTFQYTPEFREDLYKNSKELGVDHILIANPLPRQGDGYYPSSPGDICRNIETTSYIQKLECYRQCPDSNSCSIGYLGFASGKLIIDLVLRHETQKLAEAGLEVIDTFNSNGVELLLLRYI